MILSDARIRAAMANKEIEFDMDIPDQNIQPASIDLRLGSMLYYYFENQMFIENDFEQWTLEPNECILAHTMESIKLGSGLVARVEGKSSIARKFVAVHITAGFIDPGFNGNITLEIVNMSPLPFVLTEGMRICQICFDRIEGNVLRPYGTKGLGSHYQNSIGVVLPGKD